MNKKIARNSLLMVVGQTIGRLLRAAIIIYAARILGAGSWGALQNALSISGFFVVFADLGINSLLIRESNKNPEERQHYLSTAFFIKAILVSIFALTINAFAGKLSHLPEAVSLMPIIAFIFIFDSFRDLGSALARSLEKMEIEAIVSVITNLAIVILGVLALNRFHTSQAFAIAYALGAGIGIIAAFWPLREYFRGLWKNFRKLLVKPIIFSAWPFGLVSLLGIVMINTDVFLLGLMSTAEQVGFYSAAQKPVQFIYLIPTLLATAFLPSLSRLANREDKRKQFRDQVEQGIKTTLFIAIPATIGGAILAKPIILLLYGNAYLAATTSFFILCLTFIAVFPSALIMNAAFAGGVQRDFVVYSFLGIAGNFILDILLIPRFGIAGAAFATLLNQIFVNAYVWNRMKKITDFIVLSHLKKIIAAGAVMSIATFIGLRINAPVLLNILISGGVYLGILLLLKEDLFKRFTKLDTEYLDDVEAF